MAEVYRYAAFISYSSKDAAFAKRLHRALESYGIPNTLGELPSLVEGGKPNRIYPVFRDREELPAGELGERIKDALQQSRSLIVVCSPNAAVSAWVQKEIETFVAMGRRERVYAIIAGDAPLVDEAGGDATHLCFPPAFSGPSGDPDGLEPVAADARATKDGFRNAWLKLVAGMIGVNAGALQDRDRRRIRQLAARNAVIGVGLVAAVAAGLLTEDRWAPIVTGYLHYGRYAAPSGALPRRLPNGDYLDCDKDPYCPPMLVIPKGRFLMGSPETDKDRDPTEGPRHEVAVARFALSKFDITIAEWSACVAAGGCKDNPTPARNHWQGDDLPVTGVNWNDAQEYVRWLSSVTHQAYRLPTEAEWEYAARGATTTNAPYQKFPWGDALGTANAICVDVCGSRWDGKQPAPVGSFKPNAFGLFDMTGEVSQWVEDCWHDTYDNAPRTAFPAWRSEPCDMRVARGGAWSFTDPIYLRTAARARRDPEEDRMFDLGFRVARTLLPQ